MSSLFWQIFSITTILAALSLTDSNGLLFDAQDFPTGISTIEPVGTNNKFGNPASNLDPGGEGSDDWIEPVADISIESTTGAPAIFSIGDCSLAPVAPLQRSRRKQRRKNGFCQSPDAPAILQLQPDENKKPRMQQNRNSNTPKKQKTPNGNLPTSELNPVPNSDGNPCPPERNYQVCAARFSRLGPLSLDNRPWIEGDDSNSGDQEFCRLCELRFQD